MKKYVFILIGLIVLFLTALADPFSAKLGLFVVLVIVYLRTYFTLSFLRRRPNSKPMSSFRGFLHNLGIEMGAFLLAWFLPSLVLIVSVKTNPLGGTAHPVFCLAIIGLAIILATRRLLFCWTGVMTTATVGKVRRLITLNMSHTSGPRYVIYFDYDLHFTTQDGQSIQSADLRGFNYNKNTSEYNNGDTVSIVYNPKRPSQALIAENLYDDRYMYSAYLLFLFGLIALF